MVVLARHARKVLANPAAARLFVNGMGWEEPVDHSMSDRQGLPTFQCPEGSVLLTAATSGRHGTLTLKAVDGRRVVMAGRLGHVSRKAISAVVNEVVTLAPSGLFVDWMVPGIAVPMQIAVPITYYKYDAHPKTRPVVSPRTSRSGRARVRE